MSWITVATFSNAQEAYIVKGMLESNGIPVDMVNATIASVYPITDTWAPLELKVPAELASEADRLLRLNGDIQ